MTTRDTCQKRQKNIATTATSNKALSQSTTVPSSFYNQTFSFLSKHTHWWREDCSVSYNLHACYSNKRVTKFVHSFIYSKQPHFSFSWSDCMKLITFSFMFQILKCMYKLKVGFCMCVSLDTTNTAMQKISKQVIRTYCYVHLWWQRGELFTSS